MRILFLAHRLPYPPNKGEKIRAFWELRALAKRHVVDLFCFVDDDRDKAHIRDLRRYCNSQYVEPLSRLAGRARALSGFARGRSFTPAYFCSPTMANRIAEAMRSRSYDMIFAFSAAMAQYAQPWPDLPKILDLVDVDSDKWDQYARHSSRPASWLWRIEGRRLGQYESALVQSFNNTLVCTHAEAQLLRSKAPEGRISVLENCLDMDYYRPETVSVPVEIRALQPYLIFTGSMDYLPNIDAVQFFCRELLPSIRARVPDVRFVIAGRNPSPQVVRLASDTAVHVTGTVADIRPYLKAAAASVVPMRIARGVQTKILEALAMGVPVVASSAAAAALPEELFSLVAAESEPNLLAARVVSSLLQPPGQKVASRASVKRYIDTLDLPSQLERFVGDAGLRVARTREEEVEVPA